MNKNIYKEHGFENRYDYLVDLCFQYNVPIETVQSLANLLGEAEDFDGLIEALLDYEDFRSYEEM